MIKKLLFIVAKYLFTLLALTWRDTYVTLPKKPVIIAFWHGGMLPCWYLFQDSNSVAVVSKSNDGEILSNVLEHWGFSLIRGSSSTSGSEVLKEMVEKAKEGKNILITPDGPRGPKEQFKVGAIIASQRAQIPLILLKPTVSSAFTFQKSWDNFSLPLPFSRIEFDYKEIEAIPPSVTPNEINEIASECANWLSANQ